jgi:hypothetical protein
MNHCTVSTHIKSKPAGYQSTKYKSSVSSKTLLPAVLPGVVDRLTSAMNAGKEVYIAYTNRDPNEQRSRKIKPFEWIRYGECFKAFCFIDEMDKTFNTHKVLRIEDQAWETPTPTPPAATSEGTHTHVVHMPRFYSILYTHRYMHTFIVLNILLFAASIPTSIPTTGERMVDEKASTSFVEGWLRSMGLSRYWPTFQENGYDIIETITDLNDTTLDLLRVQAIGHRNLLLKKAKEISITSSHFPPTV